ncbi:MAG: hypothetical protein HYY35_01810 [Deltaproteobacteria bacterium]|nr:hypothetical protein [Deltaproteobacteria bacterium]
MSHRHAAALALLGWYLVMPPEARQPRGQVSPKGWSKAYRKDPGAALRRLYDVKAPLSRWAVVGSFETARQCNERRRQGVLAAPQLTTIELSKCVASDDPRLEPR